MIRKGGLWQYFNLEILSEREKNNIEKGVIKRRMKEKEGEDLSFSERLTYVHV